MSEDTKLQQLIINTLSPEQFEPITPSDTEIYLVEDDVEYASVDELTQGLNTKQDVITDLDDIRNNIATNTSNISYLDEKVRDIELFKFPNAIIIGQPTINNGQISGFSQQNYLTLPFLFDVGDRAFELNYAFRTGNDVTTAQNLFGSNYCIASYIQNGKLTVRVSSNGTSWDVVSLETTLNVLANTVYHIKIAFNKLNYTILASTDGTTYNQIGYVVNTKKPIAGNVFIGIGNNQNNPFLGVINLNRWDIRLNNSIVWEGMDDVGLATRADISLSNLDEQGEKRFNIFKAEYGVTTYNEVLEAYNSGKGVVCFTDAPNNTKMVLTISQINNQYITFVGDVTFANFIGREAVNLYSSNDSWVITGYTYLEKQANKVKSITSSSTDDQYPSAKAVYDKLQDYAENTRVEVLEERVEDLTVAKFPNVVIIGTPHIEGGQVSNYSDTSYLQFPFVDISRGQPFDIYFSFTTSNDITTQQNILDSYFGIALAIQNGKGIMALSSNGSNWDIGTSTGTNTLLPNTTYYVKYSWTGTAYSAALSTDDQTYIPDMNLASSLSPHKTTIFIGGSPNLFGAGTAHPFKGTINFNKSKVVVNGITVWEGMADVGLASRANVSLNNLDEVGEARFNAKQDVIPDLDNYIKNTNFATLQKAGILKSYPNYAFVVDSNGLTYCDTKTLDYYKTVSNSCFISKGTLENIKEDLVTSIGDTKYQAIGDYATKENVDGQWVVVNQNVVSSATINAGASLSYDVSNIFPNDNYDYEFMYEMAFIGAANSVNCSVVTDKFTQRKKPNNTGLIRFNAIHILNAKLITLRSDNDKSSNVTLDIRAYRRVGTNQ